MNLTKFRSKKLVNLNNLQISHFYSNRAVYQCSNIIYPGKANKLLLPTAKKFNCPESRQDVTTQNGCSRQCLLYVSEINAAIFIQPSHLKIKCRLAGWHGALNLNYLWFSNLSFNTAWRACHGVHWSDSSVRSEPGQWCDCSARPPWCGRRVASSNNGHATLWQWQIVLRGLLVKKYTQKKTHKFSLQITILLSYF